MLAQDRDGEGALRGRGMVSQQMGCRTRGEVWVAVSAGAEGVGAGVRSN